MPLIDKIVETRRAASASKDDIRRGTLCPYGFQQHYAPE